MQAPIHRDIPLVIKPREKRYNFDALRHGDSLEVKSLKGAREMFRRWKLRTGRRARLVGSRDYPQHLFFIDEAHAELDPV
ncbi:MAG: hypothetical protein WA397_18720 [Roseiarcus sp.]